MDPRVIWKVRLHGNLFADLAHLPFPGESELAADRSLPNRNSLALRTMTTTTTPPPRIVRTSIVIAATHAGLLYGLDAAYGTQIWRVDLACGPISAAPAPSWVTSPPSSTSPQPQLHPEGHRQCHRMTLAGSAEAAPWSAVVSVCASSGVLLLVQLRLGLGPGLRPRLRPRLGSVAGPDSPGALGVLGSSSGIAGEPATGVEQLSAATAAAMEEDWAPEVRVVGAICFPGGCRWVSLQGGCWPPAVPIITGTRD
jgi:hypothetical protein